MTTALIPIRTAKIGDDEINTVDARALHEFLGVGKDFSTWFKDRVAAYNFSLGNDFAIFPDSGENATAGRPRVEYAISLDMAKELSMVERTAKGKEARQYFIECERRALGTAPAPFKTPSTLVEALELALDQARRIETMESELTAAKPKVDAFDALMATDGLIGLMNAGRALGCHPKMFTDFLKTAWVFKEGDALLPYVQHVEDGLFVVRSQRIDEKPPVVDQDGVQIAKARPAMVVPRTYLTPAGLEFFRTRVPDGIRVKKAA